MKFFIPSLIFYIFQGNVQRKGNSARKLSNTNTVTVQGMEEIADLVVQKIEVSA